MGDRGRWRCRLRGRQIDTLAGGGTLVSFPVLITIGLPPVAANVTNTVALSPGYLGGVLSQRTEAATQRQRIRQLAVVSAVGGLAGSILLVLTSDDTFRNLIPTLILFATLLLAAQERLRARLLRNHASADPDDGAGSAPPHDPPWLAVPRVRRVDLRRLLRRRARDHAARRPRHPAARPAPPAKHA